MVENNSSKSNLTFTLPDFSLLPNPFDFEVDNSISDSQLEGVSNISSFFYPDIKNDSFNCKPDVDSIKMFVGQIPQNFTELDLLQVFEKYGKVYELRLLKDKTTGKSKGCCFVTFFTRKAAINAQNSLHNIKIFPGMHHPVQMKPADSENRNDGKLFVGMLSKKYTESEVRSMFSPYGTIEECTVLRDATGQSKGCAFVTYLNRQSAQNAVKSMHHCHVFEGCSSPLVVKFADTQKDKEMKRNNYLKSDIHNQNQVSQIVQNFPYDSINSIICSNNLLHQLQNNGNNYVCPQIPILNNLSLHPTFFNTQTPNLGTIPIRSTNIQSWNINDVLLFNNILMQLNNAVSSSVSNQCVIGCDNQSSLLQNSMEQTGFSRKFSCDGLASNNTKQIEGPEGANLFIYHLPQEFTDRKLAELFRPYGKVVSAKVFIDKVSKLSKCFGFVSYDNVLSAKVAIQKLNGYHILGKKLKVDIKKKKSATTY